MPKTFIVFKNAFYNRVQTIDNSWNLNRVFNFTALMYAVANGNFEIVRELLSQPSIDVNIKCI